MKKIIDTYPPRERLKRMCFEEYKGGICCICGGWYFHMGHNPQPFVNDKGSSCCGDCNKYIVIPAREVYPKRLERISFEHLIGGTCCICGGWYFHGGQNPAPVVNDKDSGCCIDCNEHVVIPTRLVEMVYGEGALLDENL